MSIFFNLQFSSMAGHSVCHILGLVVAVVCYLGTMVITAFSLLMDSYDPGMDHQQNGHYDDVIRTLNRQKSPIIRLLVQLLVQANDTW